MKLRVVKIAPSKFEGSTLFEAKCSEITEHDLAGKVVYARFTKEKEIGFEFEVDDSRIKTKMTKNDRKINQLT